MVLKLLKYEIKSSYRGFLLMYAVLFLSVILMNLGVNVSMFRNSMFLDFLMGISGVAYAGAIIAVIVLCLVNIIRNFNQTMFKRQSYLTHTLPVATWQTVLVKLIASALWLIVTVCMIIASAITMGLLLADGFNLGEFIELLARVQWSDIRYGSVLLTILQMLFSYGAGIMLFYFVMTVTHTCYIQKGRVIIAIVLFMVLSYLQSYITVELLLQGLLENLSTAAYLCASVLIYGIILGLYFYGTVYLLDHKMEVE